MSKIGKRSERRFQCLQLNIEHLSHNLTIEITILKSKIVPQLLKKNTSILDDNTHTKKTIKSGITIGNVRKKLKQFDFLSYVLNNHGNFC